MQVTFTEEHDWPTSCDEELQPGVRQEAPRNPPHADHCRVVVINKIRCVVYFKHVTKVTTRTHGGDDAFWGRSIAYMVELLKTLRADPQEVLATGAFADGTPAVGSTEMDDISPETADETRAHRHDNQKRNRVRVSCREMRRSTLGPAV